MKITSTLFVAACFGATLLSPAHAQSDQYTAIADDPHLNVVPRTDAEAARIAKVLAPPQDFTKPQQFEDLPGGAATVRVKPNADAFSQPSGNIGFEEELEFKVDKLHAL